MSELTREQVEDAIRNLNMESLAAELWSKTDAALRAQLAEQTARAEKAERIGGNAVGQVSYMVTEINKAFGLNLDSTPADTVQSVRESVSMLQERDGLRQQLAEAQATIAREIGNTKAALVSRDAYQAQWHATKQQLARLRSMSTVEMMCENINVKHHVEEWEDRCLRAEQQLTTLREFTTWCSMVGANVWAYQVREKAQDVLKALAQPAVGEKGK